MRRESRTSHPSDHLLSIVTAGGTREGFRIETIPDGLLDADRDAQDYDLGLSKAAVHHGAAPRQRRWRAVGDVRAADLAHELRAGGGAGARRRPQHGALLWKRGGAHGPHEAPGAQGERLPATE